MDTQQTHQEPEKKEKKLNISTGTAILTAGFLIAIAIFVSNGMKNAPTKDIAPAPTNNAPDAPIVVPKDIATVRPTDVIRGNKNAPVVIFEYSDSDCAYCQRFHPTMEAVLKAYDGKVAWVYRHFPLSMHPNANTEAVALSCVAKLGGNDAFWKYLDTVINVTLNADPKSNEQLYTFGEQVGVKTADLKTCMKDKSIQDAIIASSNEAGNIGAQGTPFSVVVNIKTGEQKIIAGAYPEDEVKKMIDELLK